jgi:hypothetical protein
MRRQSFKSLLNQNCGANVPNYNWFGKGYIRKSLEDFPATLLKVVGDPSNARRKLGSKTGFRCDQRL